MINPKTKTRLEGDCVMHMEREFAAPQALVFKAWTQREHLMKWWGPPTWPLDYCTVDLRPGGTWHYRMRGPEGEEAWGKAIYTTIEPSGRLAYADYFSDAEGAEIPPGMKTDMTFEDHGAKTLVRGVTTFASREDRDKVLEMGMIEGMSESLDRLDEVFASAIA
jgi:uncharacterized protein YndB with AHSA1/START domain